jgi:hypothetical protein
MATLGPLEIGLDGDSGIREATAPQGDFVRRRPEADVTRPVRAVRWHRQGSGRRRLRCFRRIEDQQDLVAAAKEDMATALAGDSREFQNIAIECLRGVEISGIEDRFENSARRHDICCLLFRWFQGPMPLRLRRAMPVNRRGS